MADLVIRGGTFFDGTGADGVVADVAVTDGRVVAIGRVEEAGIEEIDADGHFVTPGFVDGHTHLDAQIFWDPYAGSLTAHGVTSAVMGNCGFSLAPGNADEADLVLRSIERAEDMSREAIQRGVPWTWSSFPGYVDVVRGLPKALNLAAQIGHSALRAAVMGERAFEDEATDDDLAAMSSQVTGAITAGATGFSTSRTRAHLTKSGIPVASRFAGWREVQALVMAMADAGAGMFQLAPERSDDPGAVADYQGRLADLAAASARPVTFMVGGEEEQLVTIDRVRAAGGTAFGQVHVRGFENVYGFKTHLPFDELPVWRKVRAGSHEEQVAALRDPELRRRLIDEAVHGNYGESIGAEIRAPKYEQVTVVGEAGDASLVDVAGVRQVHPVEAMIDLSRETDLKQLFRQPISEISENLVLAALRHEHTVIAASDSGAHISQILDSNIPTYFLSHWVRDRQAFTWAEAIAMLTGRPAGVWGLADRGVLRLGAAADIVVFDADRIGSGRPKVVNDLPDGGPRLAQPAVGILATVVNGRVVMHEGQATGATPGVLLQGTPSAA